VVSALKAEGTGIAGEVGKLITAAQEANWDVGVVATPQGLGFMDAEAVEAQTGYPILLIGTHEPHRPKADGGAALFRREEALELLTPSRPAGQ
jgi:hypothetical protein